MADDLTSLDATAQAELVRKKTEACVVGIVLGADEAEQGIAPAVVDADGIRRPREMQFLEELHRDLASL